MAISIGKKITGFSVRKPGDTPTPPSNASEGGFVNDADRRLAITGVPQPTLASLRWEKRPELHSGNPGVTYMVDAPSGKFAVHVGHIQNGSPVTGYPFEAWVMGEPPRGLASLAKSISMDMRSRDRGYLKKKLESLSKTSGEPFDGVMPDGSQVRFPSAVAAFARLVLWRCQELGAFEQYEGHTPVLDALMSRKEPKTSPDGTLSWTADVHNPATGDDFVLFLKEATIEGGQRRPFSVWLSGDYPRSLDGLCKALSLDMRVIEPAWVGRKLAQLLDCEESRGDFMAQVPGSEKRQTYPSTVAYIARLILHRFEQLGLLTAAGQPVKESGVVQLTLIKSEVPKAEDKKLGALCTSCGAYAAVMMDGCLSCVSCGSSKCN